MKIAIFYHIAQMGLGAFLYQNQLHRLYASGLLEAADHIHFGVNGDQELFNVPDKAIIRRNKNWKEETETLVSLKNFCDENQDCNILYLHTKGVTLDTLPVNAWRLMMEYFVVDNWKQCIDFLSSYNVVGCNLSNQPYSHFTGNFWWTTSSYIQTLSCELLETTNRNDREYWIGSGDNFNPKSFHQLKEDINLYWNLYSEKEYIQ